MRPSFVLKRQCIKYFLILINVGMSMIDYYYVAGHFRQYYFSFWPFVLLFFMGLFLILLFLILLYHSCIIILRCKSTLILLVLVICTSPAQKLYYVIISTYILTIYSFCFCYPYTIKFTLMLLSCLFICCCFFTPSFEKC